MPSERSRRSILGGRQVGQPAADQRRELEAVARARRADRRPGRAARARRLVRRRRVDAACDVHGLGVDAGEPLRRVAAARGRASTGRRWCRRRRDRRPDRRGARRPSCPRRRRTARRPTGARWWMNARPAASPSATAAAKCWTCSRVTVSGSRCPGNVDGSHPPAVTTATGAATTRRRRAPRRRRRRPTPTPGPMPKRTSAPCAAARSCSAATVAPARQRPPSGWKSTVPSKRMCGHRSAASSGVEQLVRGAARRQRGGGRVDRRGVAVVDGAGDLEQRAAGVVLELAATAAAPPAPCARTTGSG